MKKLLLALIFMLSLCNLAFAEEGSFMKQDIKNSIQKGDKLAILMVHFGTTYDDTRAKTIDTINSIAKENFKGIEVREAYTSRIIMRRLKSKNIQKDNPLEALDKLQKDGYTHIVIQSTNIINGVEAKTLEKQIEPYKTVFKEIRIGTPLLTSPTDYKNVADVIKTKNKHLARDEAVVLVGHGTPDPGNSAYAAFDYTAKSLGYKFYVGTIESFPEFDNVVAALRRDDIKKVVLMPFMFVAGDHANNDIAGDWKENLEKEGFKVEVKLTSLGMMPEIRNIFMDHLDFSMKNKKEDMIAKKLFYANQKD